MFIAGEVADQVYSIVEGPVVIVKRRSDIAAMHSNQYIKILEYQQRCLMVDFESGKESEDYSLIVGHESDPRHLGHEGLLELVYDTPQTRTCSAICYEHVQAHSFKIKNLISLLHTFPWLWESARASLSEDSYLQQWTNANNQVWTQDNLQDGMGDGDDCEVTQLPDDDKDAQDAEDLEEKDIHMLSIKNEMNQLIERYRRLQVESKELEASGEVFEDISEEDTNDDKWAIKSVLAKTMTKSLNK